MSGEHHFHVDAAVAVGVNAAILLDQFDWWIDKNRANERHFHDGRYWTYNSTKAFAVQYPYLSQKAIRTALKKLEDGGYIIVGDYNTDRMKRPNWYSITDKGYALLYGGNCPKGQEERPLGADRTDPEGNTLYISNSYSSTNSSSYKQSSDDAQRDKTAEATRSIIDYFNERMGTHYTYRNRNINSLISARLKEGFTVEDFKTVIDNKIASWKGTEWEQFIRPKTLFAPSHFEEYLNEKPRRGRRNADYSEYDAAFHGQ